MLLGDELTRSVVLKQIELEGLMSHSKTIATKWSWRGVAYDFICICNISQKHDQLSPSASPMTSLRRCDRPRHGKHIPICMYVWLVCMQAMQAR